MKVVLNQKSIESPTLNRVRTTRKEEGTDLRTGGFIPFLLKTT